MEIVLRVVQLQGDTIAAVLTDALRSVQTNNEVYLRAMLAEGQALTDTVGQLQARYRAWSPSSRVVFRCYEDVLLDRAWACGDAAAYEGAVLRVKYGIDTQPLIRQISPELWHALLRLPDGSEYDPTANAQAGGRAFPPRVLNQRRTLTANSAAAVCQRKSDGSVACNLRGAR